MNELQIFNNPEFGEIRVIEINGEPWFVGQDVAKVLGYAKPRNAIANNVDPDDARLEGVTDSLGRTQKTTIINESGLYSLIILSSLPGARKFKRWVTSEVLPTLRKTGAYITARANPADLRRRADELESMATLNDTAKILLPIFEQAGMKPAFQALALRQIYRKAGIDLPLNDLRADRELYDLRAIARRVGLYAESGKPHERAIGAIIRVLNVPESEKELVNFEKQGHMGTTYQYTAAVVDMVQEWLVEHDCPESIPGVKAGKEIAYKVKYSKEAVRV